jgi:predicted nucleic acid-binding protein
VKKIFLDSDVILDMLLKRPGFYLPSANIIALAYERRINAVTSSVAFVNVHYFLDKYDRNNKFQLLTRIRSVISILEVGETVIDLALKSGLNDFEDTVQYYTALKANVDFIITRNIKDYKQSTIPVLTPDQFLTIL